MAKYKHIIWDWNGTLLDDTGYSVSIMNDMLRARNMAIMSEDYYKRNFGFPVRKYYKRIGFDFDKEPFEAVGTEFIERYHRNSKICNLQTYAEEVLQAVNQKGISQSILSAMKQADLEKIVEAKNVRQYFIKLIGLQDHYAMGKLESGRKWIAELHYSPSEVLMVGDTFHDYEVSREMGIDCVLLSIGHQHIEKLQETGAPIIESLKEVMNFLEN